MTIMWSICSILLFFSSFPIYITTENILDDKSNNTNNIYNLRPDLFIMDLVKQFLEKDFTTTVAPQSNITTKSILNSINEKNNKTNNFDKDSILKIVDNSEEEALNIKLSKNNQLNCEPSDEKFLYTKLEHMGGRNQGFMANSIQEAALHFSELVNEQPIDNSNDKSTQRTNEMQKSRTFSVSEEIIENKQVPMVMSAPIDHEGSGEIFNVQGLYLPNTNDALMYNDPNCDARCQRLMKVLTAAVIPSNQSFQSYYSTRIKRNFGDIETSFPDDDESNEDKIENIKSKPTSYANIPCTPQQTVYVDEKECVRRGKQLDSYGNLFSLCTACSVVYVMPSHCFPKFFNGVQCHSNDNKCIFNRNTQAVYGQCLGQTLSYKVLKNINDDSCPQWKEETIQLPIACSCALKMNSFITT